jgi:uroporphyrinogen-III synthase
VASVPRAAGANGLLRLLRRTRALAGARILFPASSLAGDELVAGLGEGGADVLQVEAYRVISRPPAPEKYAALLARGEVDAVTFTSPSAVPAVAPVLLGERAADRARRVRVVSIGPSTSAALRELGLDVAAEASPRTLSGLVEAVILALTSGE